MIRRPAPSGKWKLLELAFHAVVQGDTRGIGAGFTCKYQTPRTRQTSHLRASPQVRVKSGAFLSMTLVKCVHHLGFCGEEQPELIVTTGLQIVLLPAAPT